MLCSRSAALWSGLAGRIWPAMVSAQRSRRLSRHASPWVSGAYSMRFATFAKDCNKSESLRRPEFSTDANSHSQTHPGALSVSVVTVPVAGSPYAVWNAFSACGVLVPSASAMRALTRKDAERPLVERNRWRGGVLDVGVRHRQDSHGRFSLPSATRVKHAPCEPRIRDRAASAGVAAR